MKFVLLILFATHFFLKAEEFQYFPEPVHLSGQAVAQIQKKEADNQYYHRGNGFFINDSKTFVTNVHVLFGENYQSLRLDDLQIIQDGKTYSVRSIQKFSVIHDLCILEVADYEGPFLKLGEPIDESDIGQNYYAIGIFNSEFHIIKSVLLHKSNQQIFNDLYHPYSSYVRFNGFSGSPLLDSDGRVVGVSFSQYQWRLRAIQLYFLKEILSQPSLSQQHSWSHELQRQIVEIKKRAHQGDSFFQQILGNLVVENVQYISEPKLPTELSSNREHRISQSIKWRKKAISNNDYDVVSRYELGRVYLSQFFDTDDQEEKNQYIEQAMFWIKQAAEDGYPDAQYALGQLHSRNLVDQPLDQEAFQWMKKASDQHHARASFDIARMYLHGQIDQKVNKEKAMEWFKKSAEQGSNLGKFTLGLLYYLGAGVEQSTKTALGYFYQAGVEGNHKPSQFAVGIIRTINHLTIEGDPLSSQDWLAMAMIHGRFIFLEEILNNELLELTELTRRRDVFDLTYIQMMISSSTDLQSIREKAILELVENMEIDRNYIDL